MSFTVRPFDLFDNTTVYDQNKTTLVGKVTTKTLAGKTVIGPPIVKYRNTVTGPEAATYTEIHMTDNNRLFAITAETNGICVIGAYDISPTNGDLTYLGKINIQLPEPPTTTYVQRGFRVVDDGTTGWKIFLLVTANVTAHNGLYMVDNVNLSDFQFIAPTFPTATAPSQKAVYKLDNTPVFNLNNGAGLAIDKSNGQVIVHRGVSASSYSFMFYDYAAPITTVGALGVTTELFQYETGTLPTLLGTLLLTNSVEYSIPDSGPNTGEPCVVFHTSSTMYRGRISDLTIGSTIWPSLEFANNLGPINELTALTTLRATYSDLVDRAIILSSSSTTPASILVKPFTNDSADLITTALSAANNEAVTREMFKFKSPVAPTAFDSRQGYLAMVSGTTGARGIYVACFDADDVYDSTSIISPVLNIKNEQVLRFTVGFVRPELASPIVIYYRTSGFGSPTGGWIRAADDLDFAGISSPSGFIQIKINFKVLSNDTSNGIQLYSAGLITNSRDTISDNWEYSHDDSSPGNPSRVAFRLKSTYSSTVPNLFFRAFDLSDNLYVQSTTIANPGLFEYSIDGGVNWLALGTIPNAVGTLIRYTFAVPPGIDVRPSLRES